MNTLLPTPNLPSPSHGRFPLPFRTPLKQHQKIIRHIRDARILIRRKPVCNQRHKKDEWEPKPDAHTQRDFFRRI